MVSNERNLFETVAMTPEYSIEAYKVKTICQSNWKNVYLRETRIGVNKKL